MQQLPSILQRHFFVGGRFISCCADYGLELSSLRGSGLKILSSPYVKSRSSSSSRWWMGDFKQAIAYMEVWGIETLQASSNSEAEFTNDIMLRFKVSERGAAQIIQPRMVTQNNT